jgi:N-acetylmuramoyl-L-alanine amidase
MVPSRSPERRRARWSAVVALTLAVTAMAGCGMKKRYTGPIDLGSYPQLKSVRIFVDAGHGGSAERDPVRCGPGGIAEERVNLAVALILEDMLKRAGAEVKLSRRRDMDVPLEKRIAMAREFSPRLVVSIHHNGSQRREDSVNYPCVLAWGSPSANPQSFDFGALLLAEFRRIMDGSGAVMSDFSVYPETGTIILRETRALCPGVIGEAGFFTDETHALHLGDFHYNQLEAEAYFYAIAEYFRHASFYAEAVIDATVRRGGALANLVDHDRPGITLRLGSSAAPAAPGSVSVTMDGAPCAVRPAGEGLFSIEYGEKLYPGTRDFRVRYANMFSRQSPPYRFSVSVAVGRGEWSDLVRRGMSKVQGRRGSLEGLRMLLAALSLGRTDPDAPELMWHIARGFEKLGNEASAALYFAKLFQFYPESAQAGSVPARYRGAWFPVEPSAREMPVSEKAGAPQ